MHWIVFTAARPGAAAAALRCVAAVLMVMAAGSGVAHGQLPLDTVGTRAGSVGVHALAGGFVGRFDLDGGAETPLFGARAGIGFGELVQLTGFYWRAFDRADSEPGADAAWGAELQLNLNTGFGIAPYLSGGLARVSLVDMPSQTAALAGAGLMLPLGPILAHAGAHSYMFGVTGLRGDGSPEGVTHNWKYSAGILLAFGRGRGTRPVVVARSAPAAELAALRDSLARARAAPPAPVTRDSVLLAGDSVLMMRDSVLLARDTALVTRDSMLLALIDDTAFVRTLNGDTLLLQRIRAAVSGRDAPAARNYQSAQRIEIPLPTEGSITLRYGPEPAPPAVTAAPPMIVQLPAAVPAPVPAAAAQASTPPSPVQPPPPQQQQQPQQQPNAAAPVAPSLTPAQLDALAQQLLEGMMMALLPRMEAAQAQRMNALRDDLRRSLGEQQAFVQRELARFETSLAAEAAARTMPPAPQAGPPVAAAPTSTSPAPVAPSVVTPTPVTPAPVAQAAPAPPPDPAAERLRADLARREAALDSARAEAALRTALADAAARQPAFLTATETGRGAALVLAGTAFTDNVASISTAARNALSTIAEVLLEYPDRYIFVQAHVDESASELQSQRLSELRAEMVRSLLVQAGVDNGRISAIGYGHARPVADNDTARGRALNRRVEIVLGARAVTAQQH